MPATIAGEAEKEMKLGNNRSLSEKLVERNDGDFERGDIHQSIVNFAHMKWQEKPETRYADVVQWLKIEHGDLAAFAMLAAKYNCQVCNGGHVQYIENGYGELHKMFEDLFRALELHLTEHGSKVYSIAAEAGEAMEDFNTDLDEDEWEEQNERFNPLDDQYYEINDAWMEFFNEVLHDALVPPAKAV